MSQDNTVVHTSTDEVKVVNETSAVKPRRSSRRKVSTSDDKIVDVQTMQQDLQKKRKKRTHRWTEANKKSFYEKCVPARQASLAAKQALKKQNQTIEVSS
jgi:hypothetical protein